MRILKINGSRVELSEKTAIGINYQSSDISTIDKKRFNTTNAFSIPITAHNKTIFEFSENPTSMSDIPYQEVTVDLWDGGIHLIINGKGYVKKINSNYMVNVVKDGTIIDLLKETKLRDLLRDNFQDLGAGFGTFNAMLDDIQTNNTNGYCLPFWSFEHNLIGTSWSQNLEGNLGILVSEVFSYIETLTGYSLINAGTVTDDSVFLKLVMPYYDVVPFKPFGANFNVFLYDDPAIPATFESNLIDENYDYYGSKSVMDFLKAIAVLFNCIFDIDDLNEEINLYKFNDIVGGTVNDWSGKTIKATKKFELGKYGQNNLIEFELDKQRANENIDFVSNNINLKETAKFSIDVMRTNNGFDFWDTWYSIGSLSDGGANTIYGGEVMNPEPLQNILLFVLDALTTQTYFIGCREQTNATTGQGVSATNIEKTTLLEYDYNVYYTALESMLTDPVGYDAELDLSLLDIHEFRPNELYKIDELGGIFYVNKISGYNSKSRKATKVELFKIS